MLVNELSRMGRSLAATLAAIEGVKERGAAFRSIIDGVGTGQGPAGDLLLSVLGVVAQFERALVAERSRQGVARAKAEGKTLGGRHALSPQQRAAVRRRLADGESVRSLAALMDVRRDTVRRARDGY